MGLGFLDGPCLAACMGLRWRLGFVEVSNALAALSRLLGLAAACLQRVRLLLSWVWLLHTAGWRPCLVQHAALPRPCLPAGRAIAARTGQHQPQRPEHCFVWEQGADHTAGRGLPAGSARHQVRGTFCEQCASTIFQPGLVQCRQLCLLQVLLCTASWLGEPPRHISG